VTVDATLQAMRALPFRDLGGTIGAGTVLILAPHPDDESLGCGGLIAACCAAGRPPFVLVLTDGAGSHPRSVRHPPALLRATREQEARDAVMALGLPPDRIGFLGLPDTAAPHDGAAFDGAVSAIIGLARRLQCTSIAAPWQHDPHCDHLAAHRMAAAAAAQLHLRHIAYPVWGWTLPPDDALDAVVAGGRLDIARHLPAKRRAIAAHASQHGKVVTDDPSGFTLPPGLLAVFDAPYEVFLDVSSEAESARFPLRRGSRGFAFADHDGDRGAK
jgi:LmbE family N-acetylglucosaminyl deacetylase